VKWVIVGAGSAGCVLAHRLSESGIDDVVLVEAGPDTAPDRGADFFAALADADRVETVMASRVAGGASHPYRRGRGLGGSSAVNAMIALPGGPFESDHLVPVEPAADHELGAVDRALLAAAPDAERVPLTRRDGRRVTVADAYLPAPGSRPNLTVLTAQTVDRVVLRDRRATGVHLADGTVVDADRVVLSAGAIHSPAILLRSGVDAPGIGEGLQDHPSATVTLALRRGAVAEPGSLVVATVLRRDDIHVLPLNHLGRDAPGYGGLMAALMRVRGHGRVRLASDDPHDDPTVDFRLLADPHDRHSMVLGVALLIELARSAPFEAITEAAYLDEFGTPLSALGDEDSIDAWLRRHGGDYSHASSTCRMGVVVDDVCRVRGHDGLYVCDASVFPTVPEVNPNLPVVKLAEVIAARWRSER
jgi:choline dehydrogenase-like flavoprotein